VLPRCAPTLATLGILNIIWRWNDVLWPQLVTPDRSLYTVTQELALAGAFERHQGEGGARNGGDGDIAGAYLFLRRYVIRLVVSSGVKG
jgi:hypothetical protein